MFLIRVDQRSEINGKLIFFFHDAKRQWQDCSSFEQVRSDSIKSWMLTREHLMSWPSGGVAIPQKSHEIPHELFAWGSHESLLIAMLQHWEFTSSSWGISWETHMNFSWGWTVCYAAWSMTTNSRIGQHTPYRLAFQRAREFQRTLYYKHTPARLSE